MSSPKKAAVTVLALVACAGFFFNRQIDMNAFLFNRHHVTEASPIPLRVYNDLMTNQITHRIVRIVWILWDKGWNKAPPLQAMCLKSWIRENPSYEIRALDLTTAEALIQRSKFYSDIAWNSAAIQARSDIIRLELLARFGGIWVDASLYCNEPLDNWLPRVVNSSDFFTFERHDGAVTEQNKPWVSSWFIVATNTSNMLQTWVSQVRSEWSKRPFPNTVYGYFWVHRIFRKLVLTNETFRQEYQKMYSYDAAGPHCYFKTLPEQQRNITPPVYKIKAGSCSDVYKRLQLLDVLLR